MTSVHVTEVEVMQAPKVTETSRLSAHRRQVALVRWSLLAAPPEPDPTGFADHRDPLRGIERRRPGGTRFDSGW
jgi:hypothetical protein